jgi:hypothetical protein
MARLFPRIEIQVLRSATVHLRGHRTVALLSAKADSCFAEAPDFNPGMVIAQEST